MEIVHIDADVQSDREHVAKFILNIRPSWRTEHMDIQPLVAGNLNSLWKCFHATDKDDGIVVKLFGTVAGTMFDRKREKALMAELHNAGIGPPLYCICNNGFAYQFLHGSTLTPKQMLDPMIGELVISKMHQIHSFIPQNPTSEMKQDIFLTITPMLFNKWTELSSIISEKELYKKEMPTVDVFNKEASRVYEIYDEIQHEFPYSFCHCDMHPLNVVYDDKRHQVGVVDWELSGYASEMLEIGSHMARDPDAACKEQGICMIEQDAYIRWFVIRYLKTHPKIDAKDIDDKLVQKWLIGAYKGIYIQAMLGCFFVLLQAHLETKFLELAVQHYGKAQRAEEKFKKLMTTQ